MNDKRRYRQDSPRTAFVLARHPSAMHSDNLWSTGQITKNFYYPTPQKRCRKREELCRICYTVCPDDPVIDPIVVYRHWNTYYDFIYEPRHFATPWRMVQPFLQEHGYRLVTRGDLKDKPGFDYDPKLESHGESWNLLFSPSIQSFEGPRGFSVHTYPALDSNNNLVFIKTVPAFSEEAHIWAALTSSPLCDDPLNHTIPVLDVLYFCPDFASVGSSNADGDARLFVVMRALRALQVQVSKFNDKLSGIESIKDVATLAFQLVEGLAFMHSQGVVHNDLGTYNVVWEDLPKSGRRYYFIDFQFSHRYLPPSQGETLVPADTVLTRAWYNKSDLIEPFTNEIWNLAGLFRSIRMLSPEFPDDMRVLNDLIIGVQRSPADGQLDLVKVQTELGHWVKSLSATAAPFLQTEPSPQVNHSGKGSPDRDCPLPAWPHSVSGAVGYLPMLLASASILYHSLRNSSD